jgi:hypothetical protein
MGREAGIDPFGASWEKVVGRKDGGSDGGGGGMARKGWTAVWWECQRQIRLEGTIRRRSK